MPFHKPRAYILAMPPKTECERRGLSEAFGADAAEAFWQAWHRDVLPPLFAEDRFDVRLAYGPRGALEYFRPLTRRPGQLCFMPARDLAARWARMVEIGLAATDKVIVAASDVPVLSHDLLREVFDQLEATDVVIRRERETRFWCIGQRRWVPALWNYDFAEQEPLPGFAEHAERLGLSVAVSDSAADLDSPDAVRAFAGSLDSARFPNVGAALPGLGL